MKTVCQENSCFLMTDESFKTVINSEMQLGKTREYSHKNIKAAVFICKTAT